MRISIEMPYLHSGFALLLLHSVCAEHSGAGVVGSGHLDGQVPSMASPSSWQVVSTRVPSLRVTLSEHP